MKQFSIAFISPGSNLVHRITGAETKEEALRKFFDSVNFVSYTKDDTGFECFKEDFFDGTTPAGSILEL